MRLAVSGAPVLSPEHHGRPPAGALRYTLVLFPCFVVLGLWLARRPWLAAGWLVVSGLLEALLLVYFVHWGVVA